MASAPWKYTSQKSNLIWHLAAVLVVAIWGGSFVSTKVLVNAGLGPVEIYIYRFILAYLLVLIACHRKLLANNWRDELLFMVCGLCGGSIYFIAENNAVNYTRVSDVSMIVTLGPLLTTLLIGMLYKAERSGMWTYVSSVIAFMGVGCIVFQNGFSSEGEAEVNELSAMLGNMLALAAAFSWAIYSVVLRKLNVTYSAMFITRKTFFYGLVTALPFWFISPEPFNPLSTFLRPEVIANLLFLGVVCSMVCYYLWAAVTGKLGAIVANNYLYTQPIFTMIIAAVLFPDEPITLMGCFGAFLVIGGLWFGDYMTNRTLKKNRG